MDDILIHYGDEVKALGNGKVGGYLVRFSDHTEKDFYGDYFDAKGYYGPKDGDGAETLFDHGFPVIPEDTKGLDANTLKTLEELADYTFRPVKTKRDAVGIWAETVLDMANKYEKMVYDLCERKKLGWSSGTSGHRVKREAGGKIVRWPISEGSLTPCPADKRNYGQTIPVKSLAALARVDLEFNTEPEPEVKTAPKVTGTLSDRLTRYITDLVDDGTDRDELIKRLAREAMMDASEVEKVLSGEFRRPSNARLKALGRVLDLPFETLRNLADRSAPKSIKDLFAEELAGRTPSTWELQGVYCCVVKKIAEAASSARAVGSEYDYEGQIAEATATYMEELKSAVMSQVQMYVDSDEMEEFYLKSLIGLTAGDFAEFGKSTDFDEHSQLVVTAVRELAARFRNNHEARKTQKAGRVLSEKNRNRLVKFLNDVMTAVSECQALLEETKPMASDTEKRAAITRHLRLKHERRQPIGVS